NIPEGKDVTIMGSHVRIEISDTGTGIPPEQIQKIFDPYYTTKSEGSGLGLALSISIIRKHGGILDVRSTVGEGTTFTILLPVSMEQVYPPVTEVSTMPSRNFSGSVLIMDDEELILRVSEKMLQSLGHRVLSAKNGEEAIALYREHKDAGDPFCALILDVNVSGGMGGEVAATAILEMDPAARIILSSGYFKENEDPKDHTPGISGIITKPYLMDELKQALIGLM
ncbi:response regulator, partial [Myxococcota bacterium]|nr:response regulator [Myxococcota bacterium]